MRSEKLLASCFYLILKDGAGKRQSIKGINQLRSTMQVLEERKCMWVSTLCGKSKSIVHIGHIFKAATAIPTHTWVRDNLNLFKLKYEFGSIKKLSKISNLVELKVSLNLMIYYTLKGKIHVETYVIMM